MGATERETPDMQRFLNQLLQLMQGIDAIFRFVRLIWNWSVDRIER